MVGLLVLILAVMIHPHQHQPSSKNSTLFQKLSLTNCLRETGSNGIGGIWLIRSIRKRWTLALGWWWHGNECVLIPTSLQPIPSSTSFIPGPIRWYSHTPRVRMTWIPCHRSVACRVMCIVHMRTGSSRLKEVLGRWSCFTCMLICVDKSRGSGEKLFGSTVRARIVVCVLENH